MVHDAAPRATDLLDLVGELFLHLPNRFDRLQPMTPDWERSSNSSLEQRWREALEIASACCGAVAELAVRPRPSDATVLREVLLGAASTSVLARTDRDRTMLALNATFMLMVAADLTADDDGPVGPLTTSARYAADICRVLQLCWTTALLGDPSATVDGARQLARVRWNRDLVEWMSARAEHEAVAECLRHEAPLVVASMRGVEMDQDTAIGLQCASAVDALRRWITLHTS